MNTRPISTWKKLRTNIRNRLVSGMLLLIPIGITLLVMRWLFGWLAGILYPVVEWSVDWLGDVTPLGKMGPDYVAMLVSVVSILLLLVLLYCVGSIGQLMIGKRLMGMGENLVMRIPLARSIYTASKQVVEAISLPDRAAFKSVVLVEFPRRGLWSIGFVTGKIDASDGRTLHKVFIPTTPNPTTGFFEMVPEGDLVTTSLTVEEAFKMIISGGIVSPPQLPLAEGRRLDSSAPAV